MGPINGLCQQCVCGRGGLHVSAPYNLSRNWAPPILVPISACRALVSAGQPISQRQLVQYAEKFSEAARLYHRGHLATAQAAMTEAKRFGVASEDEALRVLERRLALALAGVHGGGGSSSRSHSPGWDGTIAQAKK